MRSLQDWVFFIQLVAIVHGVTIPPAIVQQPDYDVFYKAGETVEMPCYAEARPRPVYTWKRNEIDFNPSGNDDRIIQLSNSGTIVITRTENKDEGIFQCFATNNFGVSVTIKINLREAKLKDFQIEDPVTVRPQVGMPLTLNCAPPESIPPAQVFWVIKKEKGDFEAVKYDARITMDLEYRLRFTNVKLSDFANGRGYACMAMNSIMGLSTQGRQFIVDPRGTVEQLRPASFLWASPGYQIGLRGSNFTVKCIFAGNPTPYVHWVRTNGELPARAKIESFGMELMIKNLQPDDAGTYECWATNTYTQTSTVPRSTIQVRVESRPYWLMEPENQEMWVGGTAQFNCLAGGNPEPDYEWFINGVILDNVRDPRIDGRFKRIGNRVVFSNLTQNDAMVLQCNATNKHGYIFGDAYLNVSHLPPKIAVKKNATLEFSVTSQAVVPFDLKSSANVIICNAIITTSPVATSRYGNTKMTPVVTHRDCLSEIKVKGTPPYLEMTLTTIATGRDEDWTLSVANDAGSSAVSFTVRYVDFVCVRFKTDTDTVYPEPNSTVTVNVAIQQLCPEYVEIGIIKAVVEHENENIVICNILYTDGSCLRSGSCGCNPEGFSVSKTVGDGGRERWMLSGFGQNMSDKRAEVAVDIVIKDSGFRLLTIILYVVIPLVVIIIIVVVIVAAFVCRRRHVSGQVNPRSAEVEMVPIYSRPDQDVHHYLGLPPNRHATTGDDEGGYLDLIDSDSESGIYQDPRESTALSIAPADYLHPVASAQEGPALPKRRTPADDLHPVASAQERPLSPSNAPADDLPPVASAQERPSLPSNAPEDNLDQVASAQEPPLSPSNAN